MLKTILAALAIANPPGGTHKPAAGLIDRHGSAVGPSVEVWANEEDVFHRGQQIRVYFRTTQDAYVTVFRIDTDGRLRVIYPTEPWEDNYARGGQRYETRTSGDRYAFIVDDYPGQGYLFAVASADPFAYGPLVRGDHWDYREISATGRVTGDPYVALTDLVDRIVPANYSEYSYDILPYNVEQRYDYPRFLCYDCHTYASYPYWNPYSRNCFRFRVVIYDDFYYNPVRYGGRPRIVYTRTTRVAPRYVIRDRVAADQFVTRVRERPVDATGGRVLIDPGIRGRDLSGVGQVPSPIVRRAVPDARGASGASGTGFQEVGPGRRPAAKDNTAPESGRRVNPDQPERRVAPTDPSTRRPENPDAGNEAARPTVDRRLPQLERRDPRTESGQTDDAPAARRQPEREVKPQPREDTQRARPEPQREPARQVERPRQPETRPVERPQPSRESPPAREQPQTREQPRAREPERQAQPEQKPAEKKQPENNEGGRRRVEDPS